MRAWTCAPPIRTVRARRPPRPSFNPVREASDSTSWSREPSTISGKARRAFRRCLVAAQLARIAGGGEPQMYVGSLSSARDFLDVRDVVEAYLALARRGEGAKSITFAAVAP